MTQKRFPSWMKYFTAVLAVSYFFILSSCGDDDGEPAPTMTISEIIASEQFKQSATVSADVALDSLNKFINLYPDLQALITGTAEYTLFAPSNTAFKSLMALPGLSNVALINPDIIKGVLAYHLVAGTKLKADLTSGTELSTLYTDPATAAVQKITINTDGTLKTGSTNPSIAITTPDNKATNGVMHVTATVLIPPSVGSTLTPILGTMAATVLLGKDFTNLAKVITAADAVFTENASTLQFKISTWLAMPITSTAKPTANQVGLTFLAPPNKAGTTDVLSEAVANTLMGLPDKGRSVILNHLMIDKQYSVADAPANNPLGITKFANGMTLTPQTGATKNITVSVSTPSASNPYGVALSNTPGTPTSFRPIVKKDLAANAAIGNGMLQVFAGVLQ